jgi:hypothetical protein
MTLAASAAALSRVITDDPQRYSLTDYRDHHAGYSGGTGKQDPGRPDPGQQCQARQAVTARAAVTSEAGR